MARYKSAMSVRGSSESANLRRSRDVAAWRGQRDEPLLPSSGYNYKSTRIRKSTIPIG